MNPEEQSAEINRIRTEVAERLKGLKGHPREFSLALIMLCIEMHVICSTFTKAEIAEELKEMVDYLIQCATVVKRKDIN